MEKIKWYKLDNAGKFFAFTNKSKIPAVFRYSVTCIDEIELKVLQKALNETLRIFPNFNVHLKKGVFWYYLETNTKTIKINIENIPICSKIYKDSDDVLFRINYWNNRINFEVSHIISDGIGSLKFFKTLVCKYISYKYKLQEIEDYDNSSESEKSEDSFDKYYEKGKLKIEKSPKIYQYKAKKNKDTTYIEYHIPTVSALELSHQYNVTLTSLLASILVYSYMEEMKKLELYKTIKIEIPVDLRQFFKSYTSKNFFGLTYISYKFKNKNEPFEDVVKNINTQLKNSTTLDSIKERFNQMISFEKNIFARFIPIFIKDLILSIANKIANTQSTSSLSNIGVIKLDDKLKPYIKNFNVLNTTNTLKMTVCSYENDLSIGISSKYENNQIVRNFCNFFAKRNINGILNINKEDIYEKM